MRVLRARLARWWHCLTHVGHRPVSLGPAWTQAIGCDCGRVFYVPYGDDILQAVFRNYIRAVSSERRMR